MFYLLKSSGFEAFDYRKTKEEFKRIQYDYIRRKSKGIIEGTVHLWTREKVDLYVDIILDYKKKNESYLADEEVCDYDVVKIDGTYKLVLRRKRYHGQRIEIVPLEECFDKILPVHRRNGHNPHHNKLMFKVLSRKYVIDKIWIFLIQRSCNFCKSRVEMNNFLQSEIVDTDSRFNSSYRIAVFPVNTESINAMLMVIEDRMTNFTFLRPLMKCDENTVAVELVKLFCDYGIPKMIETKDTHLMKKVIELLPNFDSEYKVYLLTITCIKFPIWCKRVLAYLKEWMDVNECTNWVAGCPIVQWQLNNVRYGYKNSTPYKDVFDMEPVKNLLVG